MYMSKNPDPIKDFVIDEIVDGLYDVDESGSWGEAHTRCENLLFTLLTYMSFAAINGIESAIRLCRNESIEEEIDYWGDILEAIEFFELDRLSFLRMGMDWILEQPKERRFKMTLLFGRNSKYRTDRVFSKLVREGLVDLATINRREIYQVLIKKREIRVDGSEDEKVHAELVELGLAQPKAPGK